MSFATEVQNKENYLYVTRKVKKPKHTHKTPKLTLSTNIWLYFVFNKIGQNWEVWHLCELKLKVDVRISELFIINMKYHLFLILYKLQRHVHCVTCGKSFSKLVLLLQHLCHPKIHCSTMSEQYQYSKIGVLKEPAWQ